MIGIAEEEKVASEGEEEEDGGADRDADGGGNCSNNRVCSTSRDPSVHG